MARRLRLGGERYTQFYITLNGDYIGIIRALKSGWKMEGDADPSLVKTIADYLKEQAED